MLYFDCTAKRFCITRNQTNTEIETNNSAAPKKRGEAALFVKSKANPARGGMAA